MANRRPDPVGYRKFEAQPLLSEGLLSVARDNGDLERKVAVGLARIADAFGRRADDEAERAGRLAGARDATAGAPTPATVSGGKVVQDGAIRVAPRASNERASYARDYLVKKHGFSPVQAAAIAGHGMQESGFNIDAVGDQGTAEGVFQWRGSRLAGLRNFARGQGKDWRDLDTQLDFAVNELHTTETTAGQALSQATTIDDAVAAFMHFERPQGYTAANPRGGHAFANRLAYARGLAGKEGGYATLPSAASVAPVSVTPVREELTVEPGTPNRFRPSGRNTVYGRAYDVAGTRTHLEMVDIAMQENQRAIYDAYKDDPALLAKALDENLTADLRDNVLEEIQPEYTVAYRRRQAGLIAKAETAKREREEQQNRVDFLGRMEELENSKSRAMEGLDAADPAAAASLADLQGTIDAHWDSAAARGIIDLADAEKFKRQSRSDTTVGFYVRQAGRMPADDIATMRAEISKDYAAGNLPGVTAGDWEKIEKGLAGAESARRTQDAKADADLEKRGEDLAKRVARGLPVTPEEFARFQLDAGTAPKGKEIVGSTLSRMRVSEAIRTQPIGAVEKNLPALLGDGAKPDDVDFARRTIAEHKKDLATDPLGVAERFGVLPVSPGLPLEGDIDPAAVSGAFAERINAARSAGRHFGVSPKYFRPGEADAIEAAVKADPARGLDIAAGLVDAAGADSETVLRELGESAPAVALSGGLIAAGGDRQAALDLIAGFGKTPDGKGYADMPVTKRVPAAQSMTGTALAFSPGEVNRLDQAAASIARKRLYDAGIDPKKEDAEAVYERAYQEAAGARFANGVQYGGFGDYDRGFWYSPQKVLIPPTIRADRFPGLMAALTDADVGAVKAKNGRVWTANDFRKAMPVAVKGGYAFALGDPGSASPLFIADEKGEPVVVDLEALRPALEPRVPGAYR